MLIIFIFHIISHGFNCALQNFKIIKCNNRINKLKTNTHTKGIIKIIAIVINNGRFVEIQDHRVEIIDQSVNYYHGWTIINGHVASLPAC